MLRCLVRYLLLRGVVGQKLRRWLRFCLLAMMACLLLVRPGWSAERVYANYSVIERSVAVESLELYARTGELNEELASYSRYFTPEQLANLRRVLLARADLDVVTVAQFFYTPQGEAILEAVGELVQTAGRQNGAKALRGAVIQAAADPEGLTPLNVLKYFPTRGVRVDLRRLLRLGGSAIATVNQTRQITAQIQAQATSENAVGRGLPLYLPGSATWTKQDFAGAGLPTDLYLPDGENLPLVVLSHGLGGDRSTFAYVAEHLASHGFAVAV
ncbi:MAG: alpha/beta hydrolase, partial [Cyanobacteria bacterium P01_A01_bin.105]